MRWMAVVALAYLVIVVGSTLVLLVLWGLDTLVEWMWL